LLIALLVYPLIIYLRFAKNRSPAFPNAFCVKI
jgi:hypothetical protein